MVSVIGVKFPNNSKMYFFDPGEDLINPGMHVVVETSRGVEYAEVVTELRKINEDILSSPLKKILRIATAEDDKHVQDNKDAEKRAYDICCEKIAEHKLDMKLVNVEYTFENSKILFYFTSNGRVDFRALVKDLAGIFKTRIELRQIGVRDEAKMLGGLGPCGRPICCGAFLNDFEPVSIKMAKDQNLSLNPTKISGICGRLMCCLKYEQDDYEESRRRMPKIGKEVTTPDGNGVVWSCNLVKETVQVRLQKGDSSEIREFALDEVEFDGKAAPALPAEPVPQNAKVSVSPDSPDNDTDDTAASPVLAETDENVKEEPAAAVPQVSAPVKDTPKAPAKPAARPVKMPAPVARSVSPAKAAPQKSVQKSEPAISSPVAVPTPAPAAAAAPQKSAWQLALEKAKAKAAEMQNQNK